MYLSSMYQDNDGVFEGDKALVWQTEQELCYHQVFNVATIKQDNLIA